MLITNKADYTRFAEEGRLCALLCWYPHLCLILDFFFDVEDDFGTVYARKF